MRLWSPWGMPRHLVSSHEEAVDIVQETCRRALRNARTIEAHASPRAHLFSTLRNLCVDGHRKGAAGPRIVSLEETRSEGGELHAPPPGVWIAPAIIRESLDADVQAALDMRTEELRSALWLREVEGLTYDELSEAMDVPVGTARSRLFRARERMAAALVGRARRAATAPGKEAQS